MHQKLNISIVLFNEDKNILTKCIKSVLACNQINTLFLIDNSPEDGLRNIVSECRVKYIHNPNNPGFGASHNIAMKQSISDNIDYHLVLNPDIYFQTGVLENIIEYLDQNTDIGHLMPKILFPNGQFQFLCKRNPTVFDLFVRGFLPNNIKRLIQSRLNYFEYRDHDLDSPIFNVPYLSGCFMFLRVSTLKTVGLFDDKFFMYLEDADLTRRILNASKTLYYPRVIVYHHYAGLTHKKLKFKIITIKSAYVYFTKWGVMKHLI